MLWSVLATILLEPVPVEGPYCSIDWQKDGVWFYGQFVYPEAMIDILVEDLRVRFTDYKFFANCPDSPPMS